jgi:hypothetical protein
MNCCTQIAVSYISTHLPMKHGSGEIGMNSWLVNNIVPSEADIRSRVSYDCIPSGDGMCYHVKVIKMTKELDY